MLAYALQAEKERVVAECEAAMRWLDEKEALQKSLRKVGGTGWAGARAAYMYGLL